MRRWLVLLLLLCLCGAARAETLCVSMAGVSALVDAQGCDLLPEGSFSSVFETGLDGVFAAGAPGDYGLYGEAGEALCADRFSMAAADGDVLVVRQNGLYGALDARGRLRAEPSWTQLVSDGRDGFLVLTGDPLDDQPDAVFHIDATGVVRQTGVSLMGGLRRLRENRMPFEGADGRWGCLDGNGGLVIAATWRHIGDFGNGLALVAGADGRGAIDLNGHVVIESVYDVLARGDAMIAGLTGEGRLDVYSPDGRTLRFSLESGDLQFALVGDKLALWDGTGARLLDARGAEICVASDRASFAPGLNGQIIVSESRGFETEQWLIDPDGGTASGRFQRILPLCGERYAFLSVNGVDYYSAELDMLQKSWDYSSLRYGLMDARGRQLLPAEYLEIRALGESHLLIETAYEVQLTDLNGVPVRVWPKPEAGAAN